MQNNNDDGIYPEKIEPLKAEDEDKGFPAVSNSGLPEPDRSRILDRQAYVQEVRLEGENRKIIVNDGSKDLVTIGRLSDDSSGAKFNDGVKDILTIGSIDANNTGLVLQDASRNLAAMFSDTDGNVAFKVAKPGFDVLTAADDELIFNSAQNVFKIVDSGTGAVPSVTVTNSTGSASWVSNSSQTTIAHSLGYIPAVNAFVDETSFGGSYRQTPYWSGNALGIGLNVRLFEVSVGVDVSNVYIRTFCIAYLNNGASTSLTPTSGTLTYYLLQETANQ